MFAGSPTSPRSATAGILVALLAGAGWAQEEASSKTRPAVSPPDQETQASEAGAEPEPEQPRYRFLDDASHLLGDWLDSGLVEPLELGASQGGRPIFGVQFGGAGGRPLAERSTIFLVGGLDGISMAGSEAVIRAVDGLLARADQLPPDVAFVVVPWANPDGLARWRALGCADGRNDRPVDDDGDGRVGEDGPDDVDGDGIVLEMLLEDRDGTWVLGPDGRFLQPAREGEAPRFLRTREGEDDDGDGLYNEDAGGGVVIDHNFPVHWRGAWTGVPSGMWPLSEPASAALAELALRRRTALFLSFQGNHGLLAGPGGLTPPPGASELDFPLACDAPAYRTLLESFRRTASRAQDHLPSLQAASGKDRPGTAVDWFYAALGALSAEVAIWGPHLASSGESPAGPAYPSSTDEAWAGWLDETRGGIGFVKWQPLDLAGGQTAWIGGWKPFTCFNPEPATMLELARGLDEFCLDLASGLPRLQLEFEERSREGNVCFLRGRLRNAGRLPSGVGPGGKDYGARVRVDVRHLLALMEAIGGADLHTLFVFAAKTGLSDHMRRQ